LIVFIVYHQFLLPQPKSRFSAPMLSSAFKRLDVAIPLRKWIASLPVRFVEDRWLMKSY